VNKHDSEELKRRSKAAGLTPKKLIAAGKKARRGGSRYMDGHGFQKKSWPDSVKQIRRAEAWIKAILARGATVPEAWWDIFCTFQVAMENVRFARVRGAKLARDAKRK
jgi:hypothetical protein